MPLVTVKHSITRYRITLEAFAVRLKKVNTKMDGVWKTPAQMQRLAFASAHKRLASIATNRILSDR
jgi:adenine-specific DNA glycosylase